MTTALRGSNYNCKFGRDPHLVQKFITAKLIKHDLDFLLLQEATDYLPLLRLIPGYTLIAFEVEKGQGDEAILVKNAVALGKAWSRQVNETRYFQENGNQRPVLHMPTVLLDGWLRVCSIHAPVSVDWTTPGRGLGPDEVKAAAVAAVALAEKAAGEAHGPELRVKAYTEMAVSLTEFDRLRRKREADAAVLFGGDWNEPMRSTGSFSPSWIAEKCGMKLPTPAVPGIDYAMVRGATITNIKREDHGGSDHPFVWYIVTRDVVTPPPVKHPAVCPTCGQKWPQV